MEQFEVVEKLREKTGLSYEEAKRTLEETNWDLLEAMVRLEAGGRVHAAQAMDKPQDGAREAAEAQQRDAAEAQQREAQAQKAQAAREERIHKADGVLHSIGSFLSRIADMGMRNTLEMRRDSKVVMSLPLLVVVLLMLVAFWLVVPAAIVAACFGFRFGFRGKDVERVTHSEGNTQPQR